MATKNPWLNPYQRSFNSIKEQLRIALQERVPEITDYSEGNIFMIILSIYAAIAEVLHYYIDNMARETFFVTARRYSSLYKHAKLVDYHIKSAIPACVDLTLYVKEGTLPSSFTIPAGTVFTSDDGKLWVVNASNGIHWDKDKYPKSIKVPVIQKELVGDPGSIYFGQITSPDISIVVQGIPEGKKYVEGSMVLTVGGDLWELVDTFAYSSAEDKHYKVELDDSLTPTIIFGDGTFGKKPTVGSQVYGYFHVTYGSEGNIPKDTQWTIPDIPGADTSILAATNSYDAAAGSDYEDFDKLKQHIPLSIKSLGVAITKEDFEAAAILVGGVNKAYAEYVCGKEVKIYITPDNGGIEASQALIEEVARKLNSVKVITTNISVLPVHQAIIYLDLDVQGKKSANTLDIKNQIVEALEGMYGYNNAELGRGVRISDVYGLIDGLTMVDYLTIKRMYLVPSPIIISSTGSSASPELSITSFNQIAYDSDVDYEDIFITITGTGYNLSIRDQVFSGVLGTSLEVDLDNIKFSITIGTSTAAYNEGDRYWMYIGRMNTNLITQATNTYKAIPVFVNRADNLILDIHESV